MGSGTDMARIEEALAATRLTSAWPAPATEALVSAAVLRSFSRGEYAMREGEPADRLIVVIEGLFVLSKNGLNGRRFIYGDIRPGQLGGLVPVFDGFPGTFDMVARDKATAIVVPGETVRKIAATYPEVAMQFVRAMCRRSRIDYEAIALRTMNSTRSRLAKYLLWLGRGPSTDATGGIIVEGAASQEELADTLGAARQTINREMKRLEDDGVVRLGYRSLAIIDRDKLFEIASEEDLIPSAVYDRILHMPKEHFPTSD
jgi:CRP-like cAMP-binding protein